MTTAEIKLDLFRKIDNLSEAELAKFYDILVSFLNSSLRYNLSEEEVQAIDDALKASEKGEIYTHDEVVEDFRQKYPSLKFK